MDKKEFLDQLRTSLTGLPQGDIDERVSFYEEMIDDRIEEGMSEEDAVRQIGTVDEVVSQIIAEMPLSKLVKEKVRPKRRLLAWEIVLLVLGSPIWLSLVIAAVAVLLSLFVTVWAVIGSLWAVVGSLVVGGFSGVLSLIVFTIQGYIWTGFCFLGAGLILLGLSIFAFFGCKSLTRLLLMLTKKSVCCVKIMFVGRRREA